MLIYYALFIVAYSCNLNQKYWCNSFNAERSCYSNIDCDADSNPINLPNSLIDSYTISLKNLLINTTCDFQDFINCNWFEMEDYTECVEEHNCTMLFDPRFLSLLPESEWIAARPKILKSSTVTIKELEHYIGFQSCIYKCKNLCIQEQDPRQECIENCILVFCV